MTAGEALVAAVLAELRTAELDPLMVFDAPPVRASPPYAVIEEPALKADNAAGVTGRVGTVAITYQDSGERPMRLRGCIALAEELADLVRLGLVACRDAATSLDVDTAASPASAAPDVPSAPVRSSSW